MLLSGENEKLPELGNKFGVLSFKILIIVQSTDTECQLKEKMTF